MARAGRKRKEGRRDEKGKLRPIIMPDRGNERTAAKREKFGTDGADAIGRAYRAGLLGEDGQILMQTARSFHRAYWPMFGVGQPGCTLGDRTGGGGEGNIDSERWVVKTVNRIGAMGRDYRKAFDELVLDFNPDFGPSWLDQLIFLAEQRAIANKRLASPAIEDGTAEGIRLGIEALETITENAKENLDLAIRVLNELAA